MTALHIGVVGLGLIGGSLAKAYSEAGHTVYGYDTDGAVQSFAQLSGAINDTLDADTVKECDALFLAVLPFAAVDYLENAAAGIAAHTVVFDCCGIKRFVCDSCFPLARKYGFTFVGGHPMAGSHKAGFKHSRANLFHGASMILTPPAYDDAALFGRIETLLKPVGFGRLTITTPSMHDEMIAFSSQMPHLISNAFIKSPSAINHKGFSAGSYKDLTRVAQLDARMWAELFLNNSDFLTYELDTFIKALSGYRQALLEGDAAALTELLEEGSRIKEAVERL